MITHSHLQRLPIVGRLVKALQKPARRCFVPFRRRAGIPLVSRPAGLVRLWKLWPAMSSGSSSAAFSGGTHE